MKNWDRRHLPSLNSFATFEVAAKHLSFTVAASELCVTQAAVSQQIKYLEKAVNRQLFLRKHNALELTPEGRGLLSAIARGLDSISNAVAELQGTNEADNITCSATVAAASHWLKPLTDQYTTLNPSTNFVILASDEDDTLRNFEEVDIALICGNERCEVGETVYFLFPEVVKPVCSPEFLKANGPYCDPGDLAGGALMHLHQKHWNSAAIGWQPITWHHWFSVAGHDCDDSLPGLISNNYSVLLDAALNGQGIILGWQHIVKSRIDAKKLTIAHDTSLKVDRGNYLKVNTNSKKSRVVVDFLDYLLEVHREWDLW